MKFFSIFYVIAFLVYLGFGLYILYLYISEKLKTLLYPVFFILCVFFSLSSLNYAFLVSSKTEADCWFWFKLTVPAIALFPPILLDFFLSITKVNKSKFRWLILLNYLLGVAFLIKGLTGTLTISKFVQKEYGWEGIHSVGYPWYTAYTIYYIGNLFICIFLIIFWLFRTDSIREKKQAKVMLISSLITSIVNIVIQTVLPSLKIYVIPKAPLVVMLIWIFGIWFAMIRYRFMMPTLQISSSEIISNIDEMVLILNTKLNIIEVNNKFLDFMCVKEKEVIDRSIFDFIFADDFIKSSFQLLLNGSEEKFLCRIDYIGKSKESIITDSYVSLIRDRFLDSIGILMISRENKSIKQFQRIYKITDRELEIIELSISGLSNIELSEKLGITKRTVETHIANIYNKLGISSKVELINIAHDFNLFKKRLEIIHNFDLAKKLV